MAIYLMVGIPASGKSTYVKNNLHKSFEIVSSDNIREELFGNVAEQKRNDIVFNTMFKRTLAFANLGLNVYYDATNINRKKRINLIKNIKEKIPNIDIHGVVMATPYRQCLKNNLGRKNQVPNFVIKRMYYSFQPPAFEEGFTTIRYIQKYKPLDLEKNLTISKIVPHNNKYHRLTIGNHMLEAEKFIDRYYEIHPNIEEKEKNLLRLAARYHDIGKLETKKFENGRGEETEDAHYYSHQNVGAYQIMCSNLIKMCDNQTILINLVYHHMDYYFDNKINKTKKFFSNTDYSKNFIECLDLLHQADLNSH